MAGGKMHIGLPLILPLDPPWPYATEIINSLAYFNHLGPLVLFFFTKRLSQKGEAWHNAPLDTLLRAIKVTIIFSYEIANIGL